MKKRIVFALALVSGLAVAGYYGTSHLRAEKPAETPAALTPVYVTLAKEGRIYDSVEALGTANSTESVNITANVSDLLREIRFADGQHVKKDDVIAVLEQRELLAQLAAARARLEQENRELARLEGLLRDKAVPRQDYDQRLTSLEITKREVEEIEARIAYRTITAPFDGVVGVRMISVGALVQPGQVITTLDDISSIKLDFTVPSAYLPSLKPGVAIEAESDALSGLVFRGQVESVNTRVDPVTRAVLVRAVLPNADGQLKPGLLLRVRLIKNERSGIILPEESILQRQKNHYVLVVGEDGDKVEERQVTVGARLPGRVEITKGVDAGERVIVRGLNRVRAGQAVNVAETVPGVPEWGADAAPAAPQADAPAGTKEP
ncbi:MAG TPA: efflux RND transporter periplasmic adaptor subunit [Alphaproteobacteria bacterium]|nr:efflux RND transporter periplasmic adaptor subunit [Alphaproteobacteria bacterium]